MESELLYALLELPLGMVVVFIGAYIFVNAIEYVGHRMRWGASFVGAILAPLFTSIPEMVLFLVAVFAYGGAAGEKIGIGTLYGQPFMASSLAYGLVLIAMILGYRVGKRNDMVLEVERTLAIPYTFMAILFPLTLLPDALKIRAGLQHVLGAIFLGFYIYYVTLMYRRRRLGVESEESEVEDPYFYKFLRRRGHPLGLALFQLLVAVLVLYYGSEILVESIDVVSKEVGVSPLGAAVILAPAATAIPETMSAMIWAYRGKDTLAVGAVVGENILYATFYPGLGMLVVPWHLDIHAYLSVMATLSIVLLILYYIRKGYISTKVMALGLAWFITYGIIVFVLQI
ncbi:MAG: hypothetical protein QXU97_01315 [Fervidicoccaceae archaeon]